MGVSFEDVIVEIKLKSDMNEEKCNYEAQRKKIPALRVYFPREQTGCFQNT